MLGLTSRPWKTGIMPRVSTLGLRPLPLRFHPQVALTSLGALLPLLLAWEEVRISESLLPLGEELAYDEGIGCLLPPVLRAAGLSAGSGSGP